MGLNSKIENLIIFQKWLKLSKIPTDLSSKGPTKPFSTEKEL